MPPGAGGAWKQKGRSAEREDIMKKLLALVMVFALTLTMGIGMFASAATNPPPSLVKVYDKDGNVIDTSKGVGMDTDIASIDLPKVYSILNDDTVSPAEKFTFTVSGDMKDVKINGEAVPSGKTVPLPYFLSGNSQSATGTISFTEGEATTEGAAEVVRLYVPRYTDAGTYSYKITETDGGNAGVTYGEEIYLIVYAYPGDDVITNVHAVAVHFEDAEGNKIDRIENKWSAGTLSVYKKVTGDLGDDQEEFTLKVDFSSTAPVNGTITYSVGGQDKSIAPSAWTKGESAWTASAEITVKHDTTVDFENVPYTVSYTVSEPDPKDYTPSYENEEGTMDDDEIDVTVTNNRDSGGNIDAGVLLDSLPYVLVLALVAAGAVLFIVNRRRSAALSD